MTPAERMFHVYAGADRSHFIADLSCPEIRPNGKRVPKYRKVPGPATIAEFKAHLAGKCGLLGVPVSESGTTSWGKIDIDDYKLDLTAIARKVSKLGLPLIVERSKSGGAWS